MAKSDLKSESQLEAEALAVAPIYGKPRFGIPASRTVSERFGRVSCKMLDVYVPILGTGLTLIAAMYASLERKSDGVSIVPSAYIPSKVLKPEIEGAIDDLSAWIENAAVKWDGYDTAYTAVAAALLGHAGDKTAAAELTKAQHKTARPVLARLVKAGGGEPVKVALR